MRKCWFFLALLLLAVVSCGNRNTIKKPEVFLNEPVMIDVLTDAYLIEAELNVLKGEGKEVGRLQVLYYDQLFEHYGITDSIFEQNLRYYAYHPDVLERMMDSVTNRFAKVQQ